MSHGKAKDPRSPFVLRPTLGETPLGQQNQTAVEMGLRRVGLDLQDPIIAFQGLVQLTELLVVSAQVQAGVGKLRVESQRRAKTLGGLVATAKLLQRGAEIVVALVRSGWIASALR